jgi:hypothetical protein
MASPVASSRTALSGDPASDRTDADRGVETAAGQAMPADGDFDLGPRLIHEELRRALYSNALSA